MSNPHRTEVDLDATSVSEPVVIHSEERLRVATETVAVGRARLVKYVVTEDVTYTVPVSREEVRLEVEHFPEHELLPVATVPAPGVLEVVRQEEQVSITKQVVAVERVRLVTRVHTVDQVVAAAVRAERVDVEQDALDMPSTDTAGPT
jgi:stress response protein YsnF